MNKKQQKRDLLVTFYSNVKPEKKKVRPAAKKRSVISMITSFLA